MNNTMDNRIPQSEQIFFSEALNETRFLLRKVMKKNSVNKSVNLSPSSPRQKKRPISIEKQKRVYYSPENNRVKNFHIKKNGNKIQFCATQNIFVFKNKKIPQKRLLQRQPVKSPKKLHIPILVTRKSQAFQNNKQKERVKNNCQKIDWAWNADKIDPWDLNVQPEDEEFLMN